MQYFRGRLTASEAQNPLSKVDKSDIALSTKWGGFCSYGDVTITHAGVGVQHRGMGVALFDRLSISTIKNDCVTMWNGGFYVNNLIIKHNAKFTYGDDNHSDVLQFFKLLLVTFQYGKEFSGLYIAEAHCEVWGEKRNGFLATERMKHSDIHLFWKGVAYETDSKLPYFVDLINANTCEIGSIEFPIDPEKVSNKGIRISDRKSKKGHKFGCSDIFIYSFAGLDVVLDDDAKEATTHFVFDVNSTIEERYQQVNDYYGW